MHLRIARDHAAHGTSDALVVDAVAMRLLSAVDTLARLPPAFIDTAWGRDWAAMKGMRNRLVHGYATVSPAVVRATVEEDLPVLEEKFVALIDDAAERPSESA